jgi:hypothetical protein
MIKRQRFFRGQLVEVRSRAEIAATLDADGKLDGVSFMPEMARYCGNQARVFRRADKTCVAGAGLRRMSATVFLEDLRCDGAFHDDCQRNCLFFWKEAWLKPAASHTAPRQADATLDRAATLWISQLPTRQDGLYSCQSTQLFGATQTLSRWNVAQFVREIFHRELSVHGFLQIVYRMDGSRKFGWTRGKKTQGKSQPSSG